MHSMTSSSAAPHNPCGRPASDPSSRYSCLRAPPRFIVGPPRFAVPPSSFSRPDRPPFPGPANRSFAMSANSDPKTVALGFIEAYNKGDDAAMLQLCDEKVHVIHHNRDVVVDGREAFGALLGGFKGAFPD